MKYLFFDVECATTKKGGFTPIYSIGFVETDTNFNINKQNDLLINPKIRRNEWMRHVKEKILAYDIKEVELQKSFASEYTNIKKLFCNNDQLVFYFASNNDDIYFINNECIRYNKDYLQFNAVNVYTLISKLKNRKSRSLIVEYANCFCKDKYILEVLNIAKSANLDELSTEFYNDILGIDKSMHRSDFDAYLTMKIVAELSIVHKDKFSRILKEITYTTNIK